MERLCVYIRVATLTQIYQQNRYGPSNQASTTIPSHSAAVTTQTSTTSQIHVITNFQEKIYHCNCSQAAQQTAELNWEEKKKTKKNLAISTTKTPQ